jgi:molybdenum cofactor cytidylyltransferase
VQRIIGILLAAGSGTRFGGNKLQTPLANGVAMGVQSARQLRSVLEEVVVVVRPDDADLCRLLALEPVTLVSCQCAHEGMGASLACGITATRNADAWLIALADMPYIRTTTLQMLVTALQAGRELVAPVHAGRRGHPVGFSAAYRSDLLALPKTGGARSVLDRHEKRLTLVSTDDPGIVFDIDEPSDLPSPVTS